jgi:ribonuclease Z
MHLNGRARELQLYCPPDLKEIIEMQLKYSETTLQFNINYHFTNPAAAEVILDNADITVETIPLDHRIATTGFLFRQKRRLRKLIKEKIEELNIPIEHYSPIKKGADYTAADGTVYLNRDLTIAPGEPKTYAYCSDTLYNENYFKQISNVDMLYHEATFMHNMLDRARITHHTTALQAGRIATLTNVKKLVIGHFSARYKTLNELLDEARATFPETELALEGKTFVID